MRRNKEGDINLLGDDLSTVIPYGITIVHEEDRKEEYFNHLTSHFIKLNDMTRREAIHTYLKNIIVQYNVLPSEVYVYEIYDFDESIRANGERGMLIRFGVFKNLPYNLI